VFGANSPKINLNGMSGGNFKFISAMTLQMHSSNYKDE
jgi:hypothetical protein